MPLSRELVSTQRSPERHSRRRSSPDARRWDRDYGRRSHSPDAGRRGHQDNSGDRDSYRSRNRSFTEKFRERDRDNHRHHSPEYGERSWRRNSDRERGGAEGRSERMRSRSRSPMRMGSTTRDRSSDVSRSEVRSSRRDDTRRSVDSLISRGPGMRSDRIYPPESEVVSSRERFNRGRPPLERETMHADLHSMRGRGSPYRRGGWRFGARRGAYYSRRSPVMASDDPTDVPKGGYYFEHDDRAASEGGSGYYRRGGGGGRFRGRGRWNRISFSPMRWEHDRFRSKSPSPENGEEDEGMLDREDDLEEEDDEEFLRGKVTLRSRVTYEVPSSKWDTDHIMEH